ncbi:hypothetical protein BC940DRAFT_302663 [Gongronella butleri]|nr:hypothetical protein BC940DRAFT_302663 [Gongronella butleri]
MPHSDKFDACRTELETAYSDMDTQLLRIIDRSTPLPDEYTCSVCYSVYRDPVTIHPCLHTFCKTCLDRVYCTCRLSHCTSRCHDQHDTSSGSAGGDDDDDDEMQRHGAVHAILGGDAPLHPAVAVLMQMPSPPGLAGMSEKKPRTKNRHKMGKRSKPAWLDARPPPNRSFHERSPVPLECHCPLSWAVPPAAQCPLCRQAFGPANCTYATDMANLIRFHFYAQLPTPAKHGNATSSRVAFNHATAWLKDASKTLAEWTFSIAGAGAPLVYTDIPPRRRPANNPYPLPLSSSSPPLSPTTTITRPAPRPNQTHQYDMVLPQDVVTYARATCLF